jgi:hypothetical protein
MGWLLDKLTGRTGEVFPEWVGEVHDARCSFRDIAFDQSARKLSIRCWRPVAGGIGVGSIWEELLVTFDRLSEFPDIQRTEVLPYYEIATVFFDPKLQRVYVCFHAALSISFSAPTPKFWYCGPTGRRLEWSQLLHDTRAV